MRREVFLLGLILLIVGLLLGTLSGTRVESIYYETVYETKHITKTVVDKIVKVPALSYTLVDFYTSGDSCSIIIDVKDRGLDIRWYLATTSGVIHEGGRVSYDYYTLQPYSDGRYYYLYLDNTYSLLTSKNVGVKVECLEEIKEEKTVPRYRETYPFSWAGPLGILMFFGGLIVMGIGIGLKPPKKSQD
ncbi:MAG: hypothetical protein QXO16_09160 [Archaeoglobaceae archaeon]